MPEERLQKILAKAGVGSRRASEDLIRAGRVRVNGQPASIGQKADLAKDRITVDGEPVRLAEPLVYVALHKPRGVISSLNPQGDRQTVRDLVPLPGRLYPVGRLDADSEGLILLTNDGDLADQLTHPRYGHEKEYRVKVRGEADEKRLNAWRRGVVISAGYRTAPARVEFERETEDGAWLRVVMHEGRKHQIREIGEHLGLLIQRIVRVRIGTLKVGDLRPGQWRALAAWEVERLRAKPVAEAKPARGRAKPKPVIEGQAGRGPAKPKPRNPRSRRV